MLIRQHGGQNNHNNLDLKKRCHQKKKDARLMAHHLQASVPKRSGQICKRWEKPKKNDYKTQELSWRKGF